MFDILIIMTIICFYEIVRVIIYDHYFVWLGYLGSDGKRVPLISM